MAVSVVLAQCRCIINRSRLGGWTCLIVCRCFHLPWFLSFGKGGSDYSDGKAEKWTLTVEPCNHQNQHQHHHVLYHRRDCYHDVSRISVKILPAVFRLIWKEIKEGSCRPISSYLHHALRMYGYPPLYCLRIPWLWRRCEFIAFCLQPYSIHSHDFSYTWAYIFFMIESLCFSLLVFIEIRGISVPIFQGLTEMYACRRHGDALAWEERVSRSVISMIIVK